MKNTALRKLLAIVLSLVLLVPSISLPAFAEMENGIYTDGDPHYGIGDTVSVLVKDSNLNTSSSTVETITAHAVSTTASSDVDFILTEEGTDSDCFRGKIKVSEVESVSGPEPSVLANLGDTITFTYSAYTTDVGVDSTSMPRANPMPGVVPVGTSIALTSITSPCSIYFTVDGTDPVVCPEQLYSSENPPVINGHTEIRAIAVAENLLNSRVCLFIYDNPPPEGQAGEIFTSGQPEPHYNIGDIVGVHVRDRDLNTDSQSRQSVTVTVAVKDGTEQISLVLTEESEDSEWFHGEVLISDSVSDAGATPPSIMAPFESTLNFIYEDTNPQVTKTTQIAIDGHYTEHPIANPSPGFYPDGTPIRLSSNTPGASIYYTINGDSPNSTDLLYDDQNPPVINGPTIIRAVAFSDNLHESVVSKFNYNFNEEFKVTVTDELSNPISGAVIIVKDQDRKHVDYRVTSSAGEANVNALLGIGQYKLYVYPPQDSNYALAKDTELPISSAGIYAGGNINITLYESIFKVRVLDHQGAVADHGSIEIQKVIDAEHYETVIDENIMPNGYFNVPQLADGTYEVKANPAWESNDSPSQWSTFSISGDTIEGPAGGVLQVEYEIAQVSGFVTKPDGDNAWFGHDFFIYVRSQETNKEVAAHVMTGYGIYKISELPDGNYYIKAISCNPEFFSSEEVLVSVNHSETKPLNLQLNPPLPPQVTGSVHTPDGLNPIEGGCIELYDHKYNYMEMGFNPPIQPDGTFSIAGLNEGTYYIKARPNDSDSNYDGYMSSDFIKVVINHEGICTDPSSPLSIYVKEKALLLSESLHIIRGDPQFQVRIDNTSLLNNNFSGLSVVISGAGGTLSSNTIDHYQPDPWGDACNIWFNVEGGSIDLPYGKYELSVYLNDQEIECYNEFSDDAFVIAYAEIAPKLISSADLTDGATFTAKVRNYVAPWTTASSIKVRINSETTHWEVDGSVNADNQIIFQVPSGLGGPYYANGWRYVEFYDISSGNEKIVANSNFDVGNVDIQEVYAEQSDNILTIKGNYLDQYMVDGVRAELFVNGREVAESDHFNNYWGTFQWFFDHRFDIDLPYSVKLYLPEQGEVFSGDVHVIPQLFCEDPIINRDINELVTIKASEVFGHGWTSSDQLEVIAEKRSGGKRVIDNPTVGNGVLSFSSQCFEDIETTYTVQVINKATGMRLGEREIHVENTKEVLYGTVRDSDGNGVTGGYVILENRELDLFEEAIVGPDGKFYYNSRFLPSQDYSFTLRAYPTFYLLPDAPGSIDLAYAGGAFSENNVTINLTKPQIVGMVEFPDGEIETYSGKVFVEDEYRHTIKEERINYNGTFKISGLNPGKYYITAVSDNPYYMPANTIAVTLSDTIQNVGVLQYRYPQVRIQVLDPAGNPIEVRREDLWFREGDNPENLNITVREAGEYLYAGKMRFGDYTVWATSPHGTDYAQSDKASFTLSNGGLQDITLMLNEPEVTVTVQDPEGNAFSDGYVEVFKGSWIMNLTFLNVIRPNSEGTFYLGGLPEGTYYLRAMVNDDSPDKGLFSASKLIRVDLPDDDNQVLLSLNDMTPRITNVEDVIISDNSLGIRLVNVSQINTLPALSAEIVNFDGSSLQTPVESNKTEIEGWTYDQHHDEMQVRFCFNDAFYLLAPGNYRLVVRDSNKTITSYDDDDGNIIEAYYYLHIGPPSVRNGTAGKEVIVDLKKPQEAPYPWNESSNLAVSFRGNDDQEMTLVPVITDTGALSIVLPALPEDDYNVLLKMDNKIIAFGSFSVGNPVVEQVFDMVQGSDILWAHGKNLNLLAGPKTTAEVYQGQTLLCKGQGGDYYDDLVLDFSDNTLVPGIYTIVIKDNGQPIYSGDFSVLPILDAEPSRLGVDYQAGDFVTLQLLRSSSATWPIDNLLKIEFCNTDTWQRFTLQNTSILYVTANDITIAMPGGLPEGNYNIDIFNCEGKFVAQSNIDIVGTIQILGTVRNASNDAAIPYARVILWNDGIWKRFIADKEGRFVIFGLPHGDYKIQPVRPNGTQYAWAPEETINIPNAPWDMNLFLTPASGISGTIRLPVGHVAPSGGLRLIVGAQAINGTIDDWEDDITFYEEVTIPEGKSSVGYKVLVDNTKTDYFVNAWIAGEHEYINNFFYNESETVYCLEDATLMNATAGDRSGIDIDISEGVTIEGTLTVPSDTPEGTIIDVVALRSNGTPEDYDDTYDNCLIMVKDGQTAYPYTLKVPANTDDKGYRVFYETKNEVLERIGLYSPNGTVYTKDLSVLLDLRTGNYSNINLAAAKRFDPSFLEAFVDENGQRVHILFNKDIDLDTFSLAGLSLKVDGDPYELHIAADGLYTDYFILNDAEVTLSYDQAIGTLHSYDGRPVPGFSEEPVANISEKEFKVTGIEDGAVVNHDVTVNVTSSAIGFSVYDGGVLLGNSVSTGSYTFIDGEHDLEFISPDLKNIITLGFTIDKSAPEITITGIQNVRNDPDGVTPVFSFADDCVEETRTVTLNNEAYDYRLPSAITAPGHYKLIATARDAAGNETIETVEFDVEWDTQEPIITLNFEDGDLYEFITPEINLAGGDNSAKYTYSAKFTKPDGSTVTYTDKDTISEISSEGTWTLEITAVNPSYVDITSTKTVHFTIDNEDPELSIMGVADNVSYHSGVTPEFILDDTVSSQEHLRNNLMVVLDRDGESVLDYAPGNTIDNEGTYILTATVTDGLNHETSATVTFIIDKTQPQIIISYVHDAVNDPAGVTPAFEFSDNYIIESRSVTLNGEAYNYSTPAAIKAPGHYVLVASARDAAGNESTETVEFDIEWDTTAPVISCNITQGAIYDSIVPTITLSGGSNKNKYTYTAVLTKPNGDTVTYTKSDTIPRLTDEGLNSFTITAVNPSYTDITSNITITFNIDYTAPTVQVTGVADDVMYFESVTPVITFTDNVAENDVLWDNASIELRKDGQVVVDYSAGNEITADGRYTLTVSTVDGNNHASQPVVVSFAIDKTAPAISILGVVHNGLYNANVTPVIGLSDNLAPQNVLWANATIVLKKNNVAVSQYNAGDSISEEGSYNLRVETTDQMGHLCMRTVDFTIDKTPPVITIENAESVLNNPNGVKPTITFADDCLLNSRSATLNGFNYDWTTYAATKAPGHYVLIAIAKDKAGNVRRAQVEFDVIWDMSAPVIASNITDASIYNLSVTPTVTLTGGSNEGEYTYTAVLRKPDGTSDTYITGSSIPGLTSEGEYTLEITAVNPSYNDIISTKIISFTIDLNTPDAAITGVTNNGVYNAPVTPVITFSDSVATKQVLWENAIIQLKKDGQLVTAYKSGDSIAIDGNYVLTAETSDRYGHLSNKATMSFTIDRTKPVITLSGALPGYTYKDQNVTITARTNEGTLTIKVNGEPLALVDNNSVITGTAGEIVSYQLELEAQDAAGNITTQKLSFTIDRLPVNILVSGVSEGQVINYTPDIAYTTFEGDAEKTGTTATIDNQPYSKNNVLAEGLHTFIAKYVSGTQTYTKTIRFVVDKSAPVITNIVAAKNDVTASGTVYAKSGDILTVEAFLADASEITGVYFDLGNVVKQIPMVYNQVAGKFEGSCSISSGNYAALQISITAVDKAGNAITNSTYANVVVIDNTKPIVDRVIDSAYLGMNGVYRLPANSIRLVAASGDTVYYKLNNGNTFNSLDSVIVSPAQGDNILAYYAVDKAGNMSDEKVFVFKNDTVRPANVTLQSPPTGLVNTELVKFIGKVEGEGPGTKVLLRRGTETIMTTMVKSSGAFEIDGVRLSEGNNSFTLIAVDYAGNESVQPVSMSRTLDSTVPILQINKPDPNGNIYNISSNESVSGIEAKFNGTDLPSSAITILSPTSISIQTPDQAEGQNTLTVWAKDAAGNIGTGSYTSTVIPANTNQNGIGVTDNTTIDIPDNAFGSQIQMVVKTIDVNEGIQYKPITAPVDFSFGENEGPEAPILVRIQIGAGLKGVMLMHIDNDGQAGTPVAAIYTISTGFDPTVISVDTPYYLSDTGELVFRTMNFSAYGPVLDNVPPQITIDTTDFTINKADYENNSGVKLKGELDDTGATITSVTVNGSALNLSLVNGDLLDSTFDIPLGITSDGTYEVVIMAEDEAGNKSDTVTRTYLVDKTEPVLTVTPSTGLTSQNTAGLTINVNEMSAVTVTTTNDVTVSTQTNQGQFTVTVELEETSNSFTIAATDTYGNTTTVSNITIVRDSTPPEITITGIDNGDVYGAGVNISVTVALEAVQRSVKIDGVDFAGGQYSTEGHHTLVATASDNVGNLATRTVEFTIDTSVPTITVSGAVNNGLYGENKTLSVNAANSDAITVTVSKNGGAAQEHSVNGLSSTVDLTAANNEQARYVVRIIATKLVDGQLRTSTSTIAATIDKKAPDLSVTALAQTSSETASITGTVDETADIFLDGIKKYDDLGAGSFSLTGIPLIMGDNTFTVKAVDTFGREMTKTITIKRISPPTDTGNPPVVLPPVIGPVPGPVVTGSTINYQPTLTAGVGVTTLSDADINKAFESSKVDSKTGIKQIEINLEAVKGANGYSVEFNAGTMLRGSDKQQYEINTAIASIVMPGNMFTSDHLRNKSKLGVSVANADISKLSKVLRDTIGNKPVLELTATADGKAFEWNNAGAPVTVSIPYTPTTQELQNPEHIVVWYIDGKGNPIAVPSGRYDPVTKSVIFEVTHFSKYAIGYHQKTYNDIANSYAKKQIEVLASKGFYQWLTGNSFNPKRDITRAEFMYLVITALNLTANFDSNFNDVKTTDYYFNAIGTAKALNITAGVGNNTFGVNRSITRQDMSTILVNALKAARRAYTEGSVTDLNQFTDHGQVARYAESSLATLVKSGILVGSNKILNPKGTFEMQQAAVVIYKIFSNK